MSLVLPNRRHIRSRAADPPWVGGGRTRTLSPHMKVRLIIAALVCLNVAVWAGRQLLG